MHYLIVPGINGSGDEHWQTLWQDAWGSAASRISPSSWDNPDLNDWCRALDRAAQPHEPGPVVLVAHSLGCLAAACWLRGRRPAVRGAFLVAPPDATGPNFPSVAAASFITPDLAPIGVPGLVVSSDDDPYCTPRSAQRLARGWTVGHVSVGRAGHVNPASGLGAWRSGQALLGAFLAGLGHP